MAVSSDIALTWRRPRQVLGRLMAGPPREDRALAILVAGCLLVFLGRLPALQRDTVLTGADFGQAATYALFGIMIVAPLLLYGLAALAWAVARGLGLAVAAWQARLALFWANLATAPAGLFYGLLVGLNGHVAATHAVGAVWIAAFVWFWVLGLRVAGQGVSHA